MWRGHKLTVPVALKQCRIVAPNIALLTTIVKGQNTLAPHNAIASLVKGELLLLGLTNPTMVWIVIAQKSFS